MPISSKVIDKLLCKYRFKYENMEDITLRLSELGSHPEEMMFLLYLPPSSQSPSFSFFLLSSLTPHHPPPKSCQDVASFSLRLNGGIWHHSPLLARCTCLCTRSMHFVILYVKAQAQPWIDVHLQLPVYLLRGRRGTTE